MNKMLAYSNVLDALDQQGVIAFDPRLFEILQRDAPQLLDIAKTVVAPPESISDADALSGKFYILDATALPQGKTEIFTDPGLDQRVVAAARAKKIYVIDPYSVYWLRKRHPEVWQRAFGNTGADVYGRLSDLERLVYCFLQGVYVYKTMKRLQENETPLNEIMATLKQIYSNHITNLDDIELMGLSFKDRNNIGTWNELAKFQEKVALNTTERFPGPYAVLRLLKKIQPRYQIPYLASRPGEAGFNTAARYAQMTGSTPMPRRYNLATPGRPNTTRRARKNRR